MKVSVKQTVAVGIAAIGVSVTLGACGGGTTISTSGGNGNTVSTATLPADWPSDVPTPQGLTLKNAVGLNTPGGRTYSGSWTGTGEAGTIYTQLSGQFTANGFTSSGAFGGASGSTGGGVSVWKKSNMTVQLTVATQDGKVVVNETAVVSSGSTPSAS